MEWLKCVKDFVTVVEEKSFSRAAARQNTTASALSKHIKWLEKELGATLLRRSTRKLSLTEMGEILYAKASHLLTEWDDIKSELLQNNRTAQGHLYVGIPHWFEMKSFMEIVPPFLKKYPDVRLEVFTGIQPFSGTEVDFDLFIARDDVLTEQDNLHRYPLFTIHRHLYAAPEYLKTRPKIKSLHDLLQHNCLYNRVFDHEGMWKFSEDSLHVKGNFTSDNAKAVLDMALAGQGIVYFSDFLVEEYVKERKLERILPQYHSDPAAICVFRRDSRYLPHITKTLIQHLQNHFKNK